MALLKLIGNKFQKRSHYTIVDNSALPLIINYRIMQIVHGGKVSQLHDLLIIRRKTFAIVQQFEAPCNKSKNLLENLCNWRLIRENRKRFPPRTICIIRYCWHWLHLTAPCSSLVGFSLSLGYVFVPLVTECSHTHMVH